MELHRTHFGIKHIQRWKKETHIMKKETKAFLIKGNQIEKALSLFNLQKIYCSHITKFETQLKNQGITGLTTILAIIYNIFSLIKAII